MSERCHGYNGWWVPGSWVIGKKPNAAGWVWNECPGCPDCQPEPEAPEPKQKEMVLE